MLHVAVPFVEDSVEASKVAVKLLICFVQACLMRILYTVIHTGIIMVVN